MFIEGGEVRKIVTNAPINLNGIVKISGSIQFTDATAYIILSSILQNKILLSGYALNQCVAQADNYLITQSDLGKLEVDDDDYILSLENNTVYVREKVDYTHIDNLEPGTLQDRIPENVCDTIEELTITGKLNGTDIKFIRSLANTKLRKLDISGCSIVSGGEAYYTINWMNKPKDDYVTSDDIISEYMFYGLTALEELILPDTAKDIFSKAMGGCLKLNSVTLGKLIGYISCGDIFTGSYALSNIRITEGNKEYLSVNNGVLMPAHYDVILTSLPCLEGTWAVANASPSPRMLERINKGAFEGCKLSRIDLSGVSYLKVIPQNAFMECSNLKYMSLPESIETIEEGAFMNCNLQTLDLSHTKITSLPGLNWTVTAGGGSGTHSAFQGNNNLKEVYLPTTLTSMGEYEFTSSELTDIYIYAAEPPAITGKLEPGEIAPVGFTRYETFYNTNYSTCKVHVPKGCKAKYIVATGWKDFLNIIEDLPNNDPNYIESEDDLQKRLDEIAERKAGGTCYIDHL